MKIKTENLFLKSALTLENPFNTTEEVYNWVAEKNKEVTVNLTRVTFNDLDKWHFSKGHVRLLHDTRGFYSINGVKITTNWGEKKEWEQPIINQPEIGYLGIITKEINGILYFLLQAKIEPGNVNNVQLSPTLQATKSNYSQLHNGRKPTYLNFFQDANNDQIILDQLQSEQGARFLKKRNRNIIIKVDKDFTVHDNFIWLTLGQIKELLKHNNLINMDTRTVISGIPFTRYDLKNDDFKFLTNVVDESQKFENKMLKSIIDSEGSLHSSTKILNWLTALKCLCELDVQPVSLSKIKEWCITESSIHHNKFKFFQVIPIKVEIENREVQKWYQPLIQPMREGIIAFVIKEINGILHFLVQAKLECGNFDILEMAPTVQCITGSYENLEDVPFLDFVLNAKQGQIRHDSFQSEEGGRFFKEQNRHLLIEVDDDFSIDVPRNYIWVSGSQLSDFLKFNNYLNIQARSLFSLISFTK